MQSRYLYERARRLVELNGSARSASSRRRSRAPRPGHVTGTMPDLDVNENSDIYYQGGY